MSKDIEFKNRDRFIQLGITISTLRRLHGMSQEELAERAMMSRSHLSAIEAPNIVRPFSVEILFNISDALGVERNRDDLVRILSDLGARLGEEGQHDLV